MAITLVYVLAHLDVVSASPESNEHVRRLLTATAIPLGLTFAGIVAFRTMQLL